MWAQNWGAGKYDRIRSTIKQVLVLEVVWSLTATGMIYLFGEGLIRLTTGTSDPEILENAVLSLRVHFAAFPFLGVLFAVRNSLQSMGRKIVPVLSSCIELTMKILSAALFIPALGFLGSCITEPITWVLMSTFLMVFYLIHSRRIYPDP